jgi:hypothetical protein
LYTTAGQLPAIRANGETLLSFSRGSGGLYVSARVYSEALKAMAQVHDNSFELNQGNAFHREPSDFSRLIIKDNAGQHAQSGDRSFQRETYHQLLPFLLPPDEGV